MSQYRANSSPDLDFPGTSKDQRYDDFALQGTILDFLRCSNLDFLSSFFHVAILCKISDEIGDSVVSFSLSLSLSHGANLDFRRCSDLDFSFSHVVMLWEVSVEIRVSVVSCALSLQILIFNVVEASNFHFLM